MDSMFNETLQQQQQEFDADYHYAMHDHMHPSEPDFSDVDSSTFANLLNQYQPQTVSPQDLMHDTVSPHTSSTFSNLTTPGTTYEISPLGTCDSALIPDTELGDDHLSWTPLFDQAAEPIASPISTVPMADLTAINTNVNHVNTAVATSPMVKTTSASPGVPNHVAPKMARKGSSPGNRHSFSAGVGKAAKRRDKPLPPIEFDPNDKEAAKRARNTMAARKSRLRKTSHTSTVEQQLEEMEARNRELEDQVEYWKNVAAMNGSAEQLTGEI